jgi:membrane associated rhomboid family serine protease
MEISQTITLILIAANVLLSIACFNDQNLMARMIMWPYGVKRYGQYYRFITSGFIHANWMHLLFNMFTLYFFGRVIETYFSIAGLGGIISYLVLYFAALIISDLPTYFKYRDNSNYHSLGASGAVSAVVFAAIVFNPWSSIFVFFIKVSALIYAVLYIWYSIYMSKRGGDNINHDAHLYGALFGLGFTIALIAAMNPGLFDLILEELKRPSLLGRP